MKTMSSWQKIYKGIVFYSSLVYLIIYLAVMDYIINISVTLGILCTVILLILPIINFFVIKNWKELDEIIPKWL